ncbi:GatB/YqeY domain-containing protein [Aliivibrio sp. SR45-2]|uniref:GatB/YqeY domain-containing protein n=1 Tax=Aliivibrio sp. SR45-2 TaxID=2760931 RepID=UPI0015FC5AED|nr:GatB/YqeY domain-containing protein [Aliivibrio sp. SR45-2]MBB1312235.1 GatB/YqeY domain-containing protein [Aliivibrio sp. SR45-2]
MALIEQLKDEQKLAMKAKDKLRLGTIRLALSEIRQREIDGHTTLSDDDIIAVLTKMVKQRRDSVLQFTAAGRDDLADKESAEILVLDDFMPQALTDEEVAELLDKVIIESGAAGMQDMGKVMGVLKPQIQGRADMGKVSQLVKSKLA